MAHKIEIVYYNLWGDKFHHMVDMYIKMPLSNERYIDAVSVEANNKLFLECYNDEYNNKGFNHCDMWLRGMLVDYVKRCSLNDGDAPYYRHYYVDWLRNTRWISRNNPELQKWCNDYESWLNDNVFEKVAKDCSKDAIKELQNAFVGFYMYFDHAANVSPIPPDRNRDEVTTQLFNVLEWCKQHDNELQTQLVNRPLLKDVENLCILATHICESFDNWSSIIGNDAVTLKLFNGVADILDNVIVPTIEQRNPTSKQPEPTPEPQPTPLVEATIKDDAPTIDADRLGSFFNAKFKGSGNNYNHFADLVKDIRTIKVAKELAMIAVMIYDCQQYFIKKPSTFAAWLREFFEVVGRNCPKDTRKSKYKPNDTIKRMFIYLE